MNSDTATYQPRSPAQRGSGLGPCSLAELEADWRAARGRLTDLVNRESEMTREAYDVAQRRAHSDIDQSFDMIEACRCANAQELRTKYALILEHCSDEHGDICRPEPFFAFRADLDMAASASEPFPAPANRLAALHAEAAAVVAGGGQIVALAADWRAAYRQAEAEEKRAVAAELAAEKHYPPHPTKFVPRGASVPQEDIESWTAATKIIDGAFGVPGLEQAADDGFALAQEIVEKIRALRPTTAVEASLRSAIIREYEYPEINRIEETNELFALVDRLLLDPKPALMQEH